METRVALLMRANPGAPECLCRCKALVEALRVTYPPEVMARVEALRDPGRGPGGPGRAADPVRDLAAAMAAPWQKDPAR